MKKPLGVTVSVMATRDHPITLRHASVSQTHCVAQRPSRRNRDLSCHALLSARGSYGIVAQLRRAAVSVVANIVEGSKRHSKREFAHFLNIAEGSAAEAGVLFDLSPELGCAPRERIEPLVKEFSGLERQRCALRKKILE